MNNAEIKFRNIWSQDETYSNHRIPGMIVTSKGTLIIYNEARRTASDWALMDIFIQRSEDQGETFGEPIYIACGTEEHHTVSNPVMMEDALGRLHILFVQDYTINGGCAWQRTSLDDGKTWSEPKEITEFTMPELHNVIAFGPGHGIRTKNGLLIVPVWMVPKSANVPLSAHWPSVMSTFCSKDNGETWFMGEIIKGFGGIHYPSVLYPNETVACETSDGRIMLNIRSFLHYRSLSYSDSGYGGWSKMEARKELVDPICFGSVIKYDGFDGKYALLMVNCADEHDRKNITLRVSFDDGKTWSVKRTIDADRGGYADIAADEKNGIIYVIYEDKFGETVYLAKMNPEWILN